MPNMPRRRAVKVCGVCHDRKIRCDIDATGVPCSKCVELSEECSIRTRKQYPPRKTAQRHHLLSSRKPPEAPSRNNDLHPPTPITPQDLTTIVSAAIPHPTPRTTTFFIGNGGYGSILTAISPSSQLHYEIFASAEKSLSIEDLTYLKAKGCFALPECRAELLDAYFRYVHPMFPVIDAGSFLEEYAEKGFEGMNLLLLWSMFLVGASYVAGMEGGRKECKEGYAARAKLLFEIGHEVDKVVLVQAAFLISFWYADTENVKQSWYWTGVGFSIAQEMGLHSRFDGAGVRSMKEEGGVLCNVWLCCLVRDVWQAFGKGRPLRLLTTGAMHSLENDAAELFTGLVLHDELLYQPDEARQIGKMWQSLIAISSTLREIITTKSPLSPTKKKELEDNLKPLPQSTSTPILHHAFHHLLLYHSAARIALSRASHDHLEAQRAANDTTNTLLAFLKDGTITYAAPVTIPLLIPAIATYLATWKTDREKVNEQLDIYERFLAAVEDNYPASTMLKMVLRAARKVVKERQGEEESCVGELGVSGLWGFEQDGFFNGSWMEEQDWYF